MGNLGGKTTKIGGIPLDFTPYCKKQGKKWPNFGFNTTAEQ
jgi:hypothetical protein